MERQLWKSIVALIATLDQSRQPRCQYTDAMIVAVWFWAVIHDRPASWACQRCHWPIDLRRRPLPSQSRLSRRLRTDSVRALLLALEHRVIAPREPGMYWMIDGKPLPIGGCSKDRQAGYGRSAGGKAKGYKLHAITDFAGQIAAWRIAPMNKDERVIAARMLKAVKLQGYVVADANYDSNQLHAICDALGERQFVTPRRYGPGRGFGHKKQTAGRLRCVQMMENPSPRFAEQLLRDRSAIERHFGNQVNWGGGLSCLPAWVRTHPRVHRWVQAKLVLTALKRGFHSASSTA
jgi:Transposase DDE domain